MLILFCNPGFVYLCSFEVIVGPSQPRAGSAHKTCASGASGANNTGRFVIKGTVNNSSIIKTRSALPLDGNKGGLPEYIIDPKNVTIKRVSGVNPEF